MAGIPPAPGFLPDHAILLGMTRDQLREVLQRVLTWPPDRQEDAAEILTSIEAQDRSPYGLTEEQAAEVRRRLADPRSQTVPFEDVFKRYRKGG
jgi:putative addiction module component (TIGR02574 family)